MKVRARFDSWIARSLRVDAIVLYPFVFFAKPRERVPKSLLNHEMVHVRQVRQHGWLRFYFVYLLEYMVCLIRLKSHYQAYREISFEQEAYRKQARFEISESELEEFGIT